MQQPALRRQRPLSRALKKGPKGRQRPPHKSCRVDDASRRVLEATAGPAPQPPAPMMTSERSHRKEPQTAMRMTLRTSSRPALLGTTAVLSVPVSVNRRCDTSTYTATHTTPDPLSTTAVDVHESVGWPRPQQETCSVLPLATFAKSDSRRVLCSAQLGTHKLL